MLNVLSVSTDEKLKDIEFNFGGFVMMRPGTVGGV